MTVAWLVLYFRTLDAEGQEPSSRAVLVGAFLLGTAALALLAPFVRQPLARVGLLSAAAAGQFAWAVLAILSLGLPLFLPAACAAAAAALNAEADSLAGVAAVVLGVAGAIAAVALGLILTPGAP